MRHLLTGHGDAEEQNSLLAFVLLRLHRHVIALLDVTRVLMPSLQRANHRDKTSGPEFLDRVEGSREPLRVQDKRMLDENDDLGARRALGEMQGQSGQSAVKVQERRKRILWRCVETKGLEGPQLPRFLVHRAWETALVFDADPDTHRERFIEQLRRIRRMAGIPKRGVMDHAREFVARVRTRLP